MNPILHPDAFWKDKAALLPDDLDELAIALRELWRSGWFAGYDRGHEDGLEE